MIACFFIGLLSSNLNCTDSYDVAKLDIWNELTSIRESAINCVIFKIQ